MDSLQITRLKTDREDVFGFIVEKNDKVFFVGTNKGYTKQPTYEWHVQELFNKNNNKKINNGEVKKALKMAISILEEDNNNPRIFSITDKCKKALRNMKGK